MPNFELYLVLLFPETSLGVFLVLDRFPCNLGWPEICSVAKMALDSVASTSQVCATMLPLLSSVCFVRWVGGGRTL